jgi:hypothetical protein
MSSEPQLRVQQQAISLVSTHIDHTARELVGSFGDAKPECIDLTASI